MASLVTVRLPMDPHTRLDPSCEISFRGAAVHFGTQIVGSIQRATVVEDGAALELSIKIDAEFPDMSGGRFSIQKD